MLYNFYFPEPIGATIISRFGSEKQYQSKKLWENTITRSEFEAFSYDCQLNANGLKDYIYLELCLEMGADSFECTSNSPKWTSFPVNGTIISAAISDEIQEFVLECRAINTYLKKPYQTIYFDLYNFVFSSNKPFYVMENFLF